LVDLIPKIYDTQRALHIQGEDGSDKIVNVNVNTGRLRQDGTPEILNDLTVGKYDLVATVGVGFSSRRQEMLDGMKETMQYAPAIAPVLAKFLFKYSDWPGAQEVSKAIEKFIGQQPEDGQQPNNAEVGGESGSVYSES
jgi:hypothetical protein